MSSTSIRKTVDLFREYIRQVSDDSVYEDEYLYDILNISRTKIIDDTLKNNRELSPWLYQRFCMKLCPATFIECSCLSIDFGCTVYRSEKPIPKPITSGDTIIQISELWGDNLLPIRETSIRYKDLRKYKKQMYYLIGDVNGAIHLFVISDKIPPKYIKAEGIFEDPDCIADLLCEDEGECFNPLGSGFNLDLTKFNALFKMTFTEHLAKDTQLPEDRTNNADSTPLKNKI